MSLAEYRALDLSAGGTIAQDLARRLDDEAQRHAVPLSSPYGARAESPALFSPAMTGWYQQHVAAPRRTAIAEVARAFDRDPMPNGNRGFLLEAERDKVEQTKLEHLRVARETFHQQNAVKELHAEIERLHAAYDRKRAEHGRDAGSWNPLIKYGGIAAIMLLEYPLNLAAFLKIDFLTPALATASVTVIAILFAFSSHMLGRIVRQWSERFGDNVTARLRADSWRQLAIGVVLFLIGAAAIVFSRSYLVSDALSRQAALGEETGGTVSIYGIALISNLAVYAVALAWVLFTEDPVPDFAEERRRLDRLKARLDTLYRTKLERQQQQRTEQARRDNEQLDRREDDQARNLRNYGSYRSLFDELRRHDAQVLALLEGHRSRLVAEARRLKIETRFSLDDLAQGGVSVERDIDGDEYLRRRLHLGYN